MEQDARTCPGCGAPADNQYPCPYCNWTPDPSEDPNLGAIEAEESPSAAVLPDGSETQSTEIDDMFVDVVQEDFPGTEIERESLRETDDSIEAEEPIQSDPVLLRELLKPGSEPEHLFEQVPEDLRGVLAARLKSAEDHEDSGFSEKIASNLRDQGYIISEDARGARLSAVPGQSGDLSPSDVVKMAADLDGGVKPRTKRPICSQCQAASPVGETQCQWCGVPFSHGQ